MTAICSFADRSPCGGAPIILIRDSLDLVLHLCAKHYTEYS